MQTSRPYGTIALSLSGGGSRAAAFHLGTLAYLARVKLLEDVAILSTVSGGSFVGATYALALARARAGESYDATFAAYYRDFKELLASAQLVAWAFDNLANGKVRIPSGRATLITALAEAYDTHLTKGARFGELWRRDLHLKEIVFNATEFHGGLAFRFWRSSKRMRSGSVRVSIPDAHARHLRLADIVAASSCIPVGCEPIVFPDDFAPPENQGAEIWDSIRAEMRATGRVGAVPVMDGGVYDNQGMESVLEAIRDPAAPGSAGRRAEASVFGRRQARAQTERRQEYENLGLFIISDTPLACENLYEVPTPPRKGRVTLRHVSAAGWAMLLGCVVSIGAILNDLYDPAAGSRFEVLQDWESWFAYILPLSIISMIVFALIRARRFLRHAFAQTPQLQAKTWSLVKHLKLRQVLDMISLRTSSTWALTGSVYFNRIRFLGYEVVDLVPELKSRVIRHEIYDVIVEEEAAALELRSVDIEPSVAMTDIARRACQLQTKLWFDSPNELRDAVACGQFTMCYNLLAHHALHPPNEPTPELEELMARARADWAILRDNPYAFVDAPLEAREAAGAAVV